MKDIFGSKCHHCGIKVKTVKIVKLGSSISTPLDLFRGDLLVVFDIYIFLFTLSNCSHMVRLLNIYIYYTFSNICIEHCTNYMLNSSSFRIIFKYRSQNLSILEISVFIAPNGLVPKSHTLTSTKLQSKNTCCPGYPCPGISSTLGM